MKYAAQRLAALPLTLLGVSVIVFLAIRMVPGDAITAMLGSEAGLLTPEQRAALAGYFGIDQPWILQYWHWLSGLPRGDLGISITYGRPVLDVVLERFPLTLELALLSMLLALTIGIPAGVLAAARADRTQDMAIRLLAMLGQSTPSFVLALVLIYVLSVGFGSLPAMGDFVSLTQDPIGNLMQMAMPVFVLGCSFAASVTRITRSAMLDALSDDYVRTARSIGVLPAGVIWRHALPNALIPVATLSGLEFGYLLGGTVIVEQVFALPGLGRLILNAITQRDYALIEGAVLFVAANFIFLNVLIDLGYAALDPRVRLGRRQ